MTRRSAFVLFELIVGTTFTFLMIGVVLSILQQLRVADARMGCTNHLREIGAGASAFMDANRSSLPRDSTNVPRWSWNVELLPFIGEEKLARQFNLGDDWWAGNNREVAAAPVKIFTCPGSPKPERTVLTSLPDGGKSFASAPTDYVGSAGVYYQSNDQKNLTPGAMHHRKITQRIRIADIQDGTSHTLLVVEMADKPNRWQSQQLVEDRSTVGQMPALSGQWAAPNWNHLRSYSRDGKQAFGPCSVNCSNGASIYGFHEGGANCLFVDGGVRFLKAGMSQELLVALVSIAGGEVLGPNDF